MATFRGWPDSRRDPAPMQGPGGWPAVGNLAGWPRMIAYDLMIRRTIGLTGYWPLDDAQGSTARDLSTAARTLTKTGTVTQQADCLVPRYKSASWAGGTNFFSAASVAQNATDNWTMEAWISCAIPLQSGAMFIGTDSSNGYGMCIGSTYGPSRSPIYLLGGVAWESFYLPSGAAWEFSGSAFVGHMAFVRRSGRMYLHVNGAQVAVGVTNTPNAPTGATIVGRVGGGNNMPWQGRIGHAAVYNVALTPMQLMARYRAGLSGWLEGE